MPVLVFLVMAFVNTFGITQPTTEGARSAARILGWVLLGAFTAVMVVAIVISRTVFGR